MKSAEPGSVGGVRRPRRGLFIKYLSLMLSLLLVIILLLGGVLLVFSLRYFREEKERTLFSVAQAAAGMVLDNYSSTSGQFLQPSVLRTSFSLASAPYGCTIFFTDGNGKTLLCTEGENCGHTSYYVPESVRNKCVENGSYAEVGYLGGIYTSRMFTVGIPLTLESEETEIPCMVFVSASASSVDRYTRDILAFFLSAALAIFMIALLVLYFMTRSMTRPLENMVSAAGQFSRGDFSMRIQVHGNDEIAELGRAFNEMASALAVLENSRRSFIANVSHELKTPMTTIGGFIDGILDGTIPPERQEHYLTIVREEVGRLSRMVRSMLELSRLESGSTEIKYSDFDLRDILMQTVFSFEQRIESKELNILGLDGEKVMIRADQGLLHQVVYNLVENAVKFVNQKGTISFRITREGQMTRVSIRNTGSGIPREELTSVFDRFYKTDRSRSLDKTGVGLGLYIVKSVVGLHGGKISVDSREGEYTEFAFTVPSAGSSPHK